MRLLGLASRKIPRTRAVLTNQQALEKLGGCTAYDGGASPYTGHDIVSEMQACLAEVCKEKATQRIRTSPVVGIMVDESVDIAVQKKLVIYCKIVHNGESKVEFGGNVEVKDGKADTIVNAIVAFLTEHDLLHKLTGLGTDGAAVMVGKNNGVGVQMHASVPHNSLITVWCVAHRLALVAHWAAKRIPYLESVQTTLVNVYKFFQYSAVRYNKLRELQKVMGMHVRRFKKPTAVRWLSLQDSVLAMIAAWGCLILFLDQEARGTTDGAAQAKGLLTKVKPFKFIAVLHVLADALEAICTCSRVFQRDVIDVVDVDDMLKATADKLATLPETPGVQYEDFMGQVACGQFQGVDVNPTDGEKGEVKNITQKLVSNVREEIEKRFPEHDMAVLRDLAKLLDPRQLPGRREGLAEYGKEELARVLNWYEVGFGLDAEEAKRDFLQYKFFLTRHREKTLAEMSRVLILNRTFPTFAKLAEISLTLPLTSVPCERGFSAQNRVHNSLRSCLSVENLNNKLRIVHESREDDFDETSVIGKASEKFLAHKRRHKSKAN